MVVIACSVAQTVAPPRKSEAGDEDKIKVGLGNSLIKFRVGLDDSETARLPLIGMSSRMPCQASVWMAEWKEKKFVRGRKQGEEVRFGFGRMEEGNDPGLLEYGQSTDAGTQLYGRGGFRAFRQACQHFPEVEAEGRFVRQMLSTDSGAKR